MLLAYPVALARDRDGSVIAQFPDVPEALTNGRDFDSAVDWAQDALVVALSAYVEAGRDIPRPSRPRRNQRMVPVPPMVAAKLAIYQAMRDRGVTQVALAERLGVDGRQIRRLLDLDHNSTLPQLAAALAALGKRLVLDVRDAA
jgi:antitoxin HicB